MKFLEIFQKISKAISKNFEEFQEILRKSLENFDKRSGNIQIYYQNF